MQPILFKKDTVKVYFLNENRKGTGVWKAVKRIKNNKVLSQYFVSVNHGFQIVMLSRNYMSSRL